MRMEKRGDSRERRETKPSKVVYLSNIPRDLPNEDELIYFGHKFGEVTKVLYLNNKGNGFLQFETVEMALACIDFCSKNKDKCYIGNRRIRCEFSHKQEIESARGHRPGRDNRSPPPGRGLAMPYDLIQPRYGDYSRRGSHLERESMLHRRDFPPEGRQKVRGLSSRIVNMPCRIDPDGTITPLGDIRDYGFGHVLENDRYSSHRRGRSRSRSPMRYGGRMRSPERRSHPSLLTCFNIPESLNIDQLATLFGVYGDVDRVKISNKNKSQCWIQFKDGEDAAKVLEYLQGVKLEGKNLQIHVSKVENLRPARESDSDKMYIDEMRRHRFQGRRRDFFSKHLCEPTTTLFASGLDSQLSIEEIQSELNAESAEYLRDDSEKSRRTAFVYFPDKESSVLALVKNHGRKLGSFDICLSFSKRMKR